MLTNEELDSFVQIVIHPNDSLTTNEALKIIAQAKEANALRGQLATARVDALEEAMDICSEVASNSNEFRVRDGANLCKMEIKEAIRALKDKP